MAAQKYRLPGQALSPQQQAQMFHARKRQRARAEATASDGGLREQNTSLGVHIVVTLTVQ